MAACFVSLVGQIGLAVGITLWFTVFQQNIPQRVQSRVSSYDTLGSFILIPLGLAAIGPLANEFGQEQTLLIAAVSYVILMGMTAALPSVRAIRQQRPPGDVRTGRAVRDARLLSLADQYRCLSWRDPTAATTLRRSSRRCLPRPWMPSSRSMPPAAC